MGQGWVTPEQFWKMHPQEVWWLIDAKRPPKRYGHLVESEMNDLLGDLEEAGFLKEKASG